MYATFIQCVTLKFFYYVILYCTQEAEVGGVKVPEPFDVRTEHAVEARMLSFEGAEVGAELDVPDGKSSHLETFPSLMSNC